MHSHSTPDDDMSDISSAHSLNLEAGIVTLAKKIDADNYWNALIMTTIGVNAAILGCFYTPTECDIVESNDDYIYDRCLDQAVEMSPSELLTLENINYACLAVFTLEMIIKLIAHGYKGYVKEAQNIFDGVIVVVSYVEILMNEVNSGAEVDFRIFRIQRMFRMLRVVRVLKMSRNVSYSL